MSELIIHDPKEIVVTSMEYCFGILELCTCRRLSQVFLPEVGEVVEKMLTPGR